MIQKQQLRHDHVRNLIVNRRAEEDNALFEQQRINIVGAFAASRILYNHRDDVLILWYHSLSPVCK